MTSQLDSQIANTPERSVARPLMLAGIGAALAGVWFTAGWGGPAALRYGADLGSCLAAGVAGFACWRAAGRAPAAYRRSWLLLSGGALAWAAGEASWTALDLTTNTAVSNDAASNLLFVLLPLLACAAVLYLPADNGMWAQSRQLLDGAVVTFSVGYVFCDAVVEHLPSVNAAGFTFFSNGLYATVDVALVIVLVLHSTRTAASRLRWGTAAAALALLAAGDAGYAYLADTGTYARGDFCDVAYVAAFAALAAAAALPDGPARRRPAPRPNSSALLLAAQYVPFVVAAGIAMYRVASGQPFPGTFLALWAVIIVLIMARQYLTILENRRLLRQLRHQQDQLRTSALTDPLTGIGNRNLFVDRVQHALDLRRRDPRPITVCWIDIDDFKLTNDTLGHAAGDQVLTALASRMSAVLRAGDTLARVGGDEFAVLLENGADPLVVAERLLACAEEPVLIDGQPVPARFSLGLSTLGEHESVAGADDLMRRADIAMYAAKAARAKHLATYQPGMTVPGAEDAALREPLKAAVETGAVEVHYQPIVAADTGDLRAFEALARWRLNGEAIPPSRFVPLAERLALGREFGHHVLSSALRQLAAWSRQRGAADLVVAVNVSPDQLLDHEFPATVADLLAENDIQAHQLILEITEGALLTNSERALVNADALTRMGVSLSLDDFGTGYSSLAHLRGFPLAAFKIDRSFLADIDTDPGARRFLRVLYRLGHDLGLELVAEGVERVGQLKIIRELGPDLVQGYLVCPPRPAAHFDDVVTAVCPALPLPPVDAPLPVA